MPKDPPSPRAETALRAFLRSFICDPRISQCDKPAIVRGSQFLSQERRCKDARRAPVAMDRQHRRCGASRMMHQLYAFDLLTADAASDSIRYNIAHDDYSIGATLKLLNRRRAFRCLPSARVVI